MRIRPLPGLASLSILLAGCTPTPPMQSLMDLSRQITGRDGLQQSAPAIDPAYRYLRVQSGNRVAFFVLGYLDPHPEGMIEVWFSAEKEVLRIRHGRLMGASGTPTEWLNVTYSHAPAWSNALDHTAYARKRDVAPGYRFGLEETLHLQPISAPEQSNLLGIPPEGLSWFMESSTAQEALRPTLYALRLEADGPRVVYSETCLDPQLCFSWQRWPAH